MKSLLAIVAALFLGAIASDAQTAAAAKNIKPDEAEKLIKENPKILVLDVRTPKEFQQGRIPKATNISIIDPDFDAKLAALDKSQPVIVHCAAGGRSRNSLPKLEEHKFTNVYHLYGGFKAWQEAGKPVEK